MAKVIKFNLILDNNPVRGLDDLRNNFNIEDVLAAYRNGSLMRWLESRELAKEIAELKKISGGDDLNTAMELCRIFLAGCTKEQLELAVYPFEFRKQEASKLQQYQNLKEQKNEIIRAYHGGYEKLLKEIEEKGEEYPFVKSALSEIHKKYLELFRMNIGWFYAQFIFDFPLVILGLLANNDLRPFLFSAENISRTKDHIFADDMENIFLDITMPARAISSFLERYRSKIPQPLLKVCSSQEEFDELCKRFRNLPILTGSSSDATISVLSVMDISSQLTDLKSNTNKKKIYFPFTYIARDITFYPCHINSFAGETEGYWKDIQPKGQKFLIIKMESGNLLRNSGNNGEELKAEDVNGKFTILDGIDYKSANAKHQLVYMEV